MQSAPPAAWFELLQRGPDKETRTVELCDKLVMFNDNFKLVMLTDLDLIMFDKEFVRMCTPLRLQEQFEVRDTQSFEKLVPAEDDLLKLLNDFNAIDILESGEVTSQVIQTVDAIPIANS